MSAAPPLPSGVERRGAEVDGGRWSFLDGGRGPLVVLLHGWPQTSLSWVALLEPLVREGYRVLAPDLRGTGGSARPVRGYGKDEQAEELRRLLEHLGVAEPVRLVGHDIGGMVAFSFARRYPGRVARLVLVDLAVPGLGLEEAMDVARGGFWHFGLFMQPEIPAMLLAGHEREFFRRWFADLSAGRGGLPPEVVEGYLDAYRGREALDASFGHYRTLLADGEVNRRWVVAGGRLSVPVLAVGGAHSAAGRLAAALRPVVTRVREAVVRDAGHFVAEEQPERFWAVLRPFLADLPEGVDRPS